MIAHVCASTGWTWEYVAADIDLVRLGHLSEYWKQHPPTHVLVAAYMGVGEKSAPSDPNGPPGQQDFSALLSLGTPTEGPFLP